MTIIAFNPSPLAVFQFQPTLDGNVYTALVPWNLFGVRYYLQLYKLDGTLMLNTALIASPPGNPIAAISWESNVATVETVLPHGFTPGSTVRLTIRSVAPIVYNGTYDCLVTSSDTFTYPLTTNPLLAATALGVASYDINMVDGYFTTSTLVFRDGANQFEINP